MNRNSSFTRKVVYAICIALLLYPLYYLGQPATRDSKGGRLAQIRAERGIAQSQLGDIDPASETMRLATLGLRGVAVALLWEKANEFKMKKDWENLSATVHQIIKLQPNFISVWEFQGHNLAYNVSVEFDDYRHRYEWVKRGTEFLVQGSQYNRDDPGLLWYIGWIVGQKFGRADEHKQFRRMFAVDEDFHRSLKENGDVAIDSPDARGPEGRPDNWLVARLWFDKGISAIRKGKSLRRKSPLIYYSTTYMQRINHAMMIEEEGTLDEKAQFAWQRAFEDWKRFGDVLVPSSWGHNVRLNDLPKFVAEQAEIAARLDELAPGAREALRAEKTAKLTPEEAATMDIPFAQRTPPQQMEGEAIRRRLMVTHSEVAEQVGDAKKREHAKAIARRLTELDEVYVVHTQRYRDQVNFDYWLRRCEIEQSKEAIEARKYLYEAERYLDDVNPDAARKSFELSWERWALLLEKYPEMMDEETVTNLSGPMKKYMNVLSQLDLKMPEDFKLRKVWDKHMQSQSERNSVIPPGLPGGPTGGPPGGPPGKPPAKPSDAADPSAATPSL